MEIIDEKYVLIFFYEKLGWKIMAEKETQQFVKVAAHLRNFTKEKPK